MKVNVQDRSFLSNQPTVHSGGFRRGRVSDQQGCTLSSFYIGATVIIALH